MSTPDEEDYVMDVLRHWLVCDVGSDLRMRVETDEPTARHARDCGYTVLGPYVLVNQAEVERNDGECPTHGPTQGFLSAPVYAGEPRDPKGTGQRCCSTCGLPLTRGAVDPAEVERLREENARLSALLVRAVGYAPPGTTQVGRAQ